MEFENIEQFFSYLVKVIAVVGIIILLFNLGYFIDKKLEQYLPKLPRPILLILIGILSVLWILIKLFSFGILEP